MRNVHYIRSQSLTDDYLLEEAEKEIAKRPEKIEKIMRIDLIREKEVFNFGNQ